MYICIIYVRIPLSLYLYIFSCSCCVSLVLCQSCRPRSPVPWNLPLPLCSSKYTKITNDRSRSTHCTANSHVSDKRITHKPLKMQQTPPGNRWNSAWLSATLPLKHSGTRSSRKSRKFKPSCKEVSRSAQTQRGRAYQPLRRKGK